MNKQRYKNIIILLAHGSPEPYMKKVLILLKNKFLKCLQRDRCDVYYAFLQFNKPTLQECLNKTLGSAFCTPQSAVVILPIFISHGKHMLYDVPKIIQNIRKRYKVDIKLALPLGSDDLIVKLLLKRFKEAKMW